jgi:thiamine-monophosphate kinase
LNEEGLLRWIRRSVDPDGRWIGDDAAFLPAGEEWAVSVDHQVAGTHFPVDLDPAAVGRRLVAVNLSDLAACGAQPCFALLALATPPGWPIRRLVRAAAGRLEAAGARLVGGDLARAAQCVASLTVIGRRPTGGRWLRRDAAREGDALWLGGTVGESAAGRLWIERGARASSSGRRVTWPDEVERELRAARRFTAAGRAVTRHLAPEPQLALGRWLARRRRAAAIDVSDGVALDLHRLCRASRVGAVIEASRIAIPPAFPWMARALGRDPLELALSGGEDYVLLFALPAGERPPARFGCTTIGRCTAGRGIFLQEGRRQRRLTASGWDHFTSAATNCGQPS